MLLISGHYTFGFSNQLKIMNPFCKIAFTFFLLIVVLIPTPSLAQEVDEIVEFLSDTLKLSEDQTTQMKELMVVYRGELDRTLAKHEDAEKLKPIMGKGLHSVVKILFENAWTRLTLPKKVSLGNKIKKIQKEADKGVQSVMTSGQYQKWQAMKEEAKGE